MAPVPPPSIGPARHDVGQHGQALGTMAAVPIDLGQHSHKPLGFPEESEKFCTLDVISSMDKHLRALSKNAGYITIPTPITNQ